jgi:hypothetical protein
MDYDDVAFIEEESPAAIPFNFALTAGTNSFLLHSNAEFYRTEFNANLTLILAEGVDISPGTIYRSADTFLAANSFNSASPTDEIIFPDMNRINILANQELIHDLRIQFKLTKSDDSKYENRRELRTTFVKGDGTQYNASFVAHNLSETGTHDNAFIKCKINHLTDDIIKIRFQLVQDTRNDDNSDTKLTIFRISWMLFGIKTETA